MSGPSTVNYDEEFEQISAVCERLWRETNAKIVFLADQNGQPIASVGATEDLDATSLASLTAGDIDATALAKLTGGLIDEKEFSILREGEKDNLHISLIGGRLILVVIFASASQIKNVRERAAKAGELIDRILRSLQSGPRPDYN
jgi:predicted regulator of Ras-like GTPase activity (Roadblock/LC7/MglB family)